jgi:hypothetical protein
MIIHKGLEQERTSSSTALPAMVRMKLANLGGTPGYKQPSTGLAALAALSNSGANVSLKLTPRGLMPCLARLNIVMEIKHHRDIS